MYLTWQARNLILGANNIPIHSCKPQNPNVELLQQNTGHHLASRMKIGTLTSYMAELVHARFAMAGVAGIIFTDTMRAIGRTNMPLWYEAGASKFDFANTRTLFKVQLLLMGLRPELFKVFFKLFAFETK